MNYIKTEDGTYYEVVRKLTPQEIKKVIQEEIKEKIYLILKDIEKYTGVKSYNFYIGGSTALVLHDCNMRIDFKDIDLFILGESNKTKVSQVYNDHDQNKAPSGSDVDYATYINGIRVEVFSKEPELDNIKSIYYKDIYINLKSIEDIIKYKLRYGLVGNSGTKHFKDIKDIIEGFLKNEEQRQIKETLTDDLPF